MSNIKYQDQRLATNMYLIIFFFLQQTNKIIPSELVDIVLFFNFLNFKKFKKPNDCAQCLVYESQSKKKN